MSTVIYPLFILHVISRLGSCILVWARGEQRYLTTCQRNNEKSERRLSCVCFFFSCAIFTLRNDRFGVLHMCGSVNLYVCVNSICRLIRAIYSKWMGVVPTDRFAFVCVFTAAKVPTALTATMLCKETNSQYTNKAICFVKQRKPERVYVKRAHTVIRVIGVERGTKICRPIERKFNDFLSASARHVDTKWESHPFNSVSYSRCCYTHPVCPVNVQHTETQWIERFMWNLNRYI